MVRLRPHYYRLVFLNDSPNSDLLYFIQFKLLLFPLLPNARGNQSYFYLDYDNLLNPLTKQIKDFAGKYENFSYSKFTNLTCKALGD